MNQTTNDCRMSYPSVYRTNPKPENMRTKIFVDGENLRYAISQLFPHEYKSSDYLPPNANWERFFQAIAFSALSPELRHTWTGSYSVHWYVVGQINYASNVSGKILTRQTKLKERFDTWKQKEDAISRLHPEIRFVREGSIACRSGQLGKEKGVDMALGRDLLCFSCDFETAVLVSRDADYEPVIRYLRRMGKRVLNVEYFDRNQRELPGNSKQLLDCVQGTIRLHFDEMSELMGY